MPTIYDFYDIHMNICYAFIIFEKKVNFVLRITVTGSDVATCVFNPTHFTHNFHTGFHFKSNIILSHSHL